MSLEQEIKDLLTEKGAGVPFVALHGNSTYFYSGGTLSLKLWKGWSLLSRSSLGNLMPA